MSFYGDEENSLCTNCRTHSNQSYCRLREVYGWSNGGYSADPANPDYGTHDWIAEHALD